MTDVSFSYDGCEAQCTYKLADRNRVNWEALFYRHGVRIGDAKGTIDRDSPPFAGSPVEHAVQRVVQQTISDLYSLAY